MFLIVVFIAALFCGGILSTLILPRSLAGKRGVVKKVFRKDNTVLVEGAKLVKKHVRGDESKKSGVFLMESPIHISNVMLIDPTDNRVCRVHWKFLENGKKVRVSTRTGAVVKKPPRGPKVRAPKTVPHPEKDTRSEVVLRKTYELPDDLLRRVEQLKLQVNDQIRTFQAAQLQQQQQQQQATQQTQPQPEEEGAAAASSSSSSSASSTQV